MSSSLKPDGIYYTQVSTTSQGGHHNIGAGEDMGKGKGHVGKNRDMGKNGDREMEKDGIWKKRKKDMRRTSERGEKGKYVDLGTVN